jgi:SAM-dependent methyltransferase
MNDIKIDTGIEKTLLKVAEFYDDKKVGHIGPLGFRRSTDLARLLDCMKNLVAMDIIVPDKSLFLDMGCGDGRVNVMFGYLVKWSVGIELDEWTLDDHSALMRRLKAELVKEGLIPVPDNIRLFNGDSMDTVLHDTVKRETGIGIEDFDLFYTYLTMHEEFADLIARKAKEGAIFMVYGLEKIMPRYEGFELITPDKPMEGILALYRKK